MLCVIQVLLPFSIAFMKYDQTITAYPTGEFHEENILVSDWNSDLSPSWSNNVCSEPVIETSGSKCNLLQISYSALWCCQFLIFNYIWINYYILYFLFWWKLNWCFVDLCSCFLIQAQCLGISCCFWCSVRLFYFDNWHFFF